MENLQIRTKSSFNGMTDGLDYKDSGFAKATTTERSLEHTLGIDGAWFVGQSRDYCTLFDNGQFTGIEVSNCCGHFIIGIPAK